MEGFSSRHWDGDLHGWSTQDVTELQSIFYSGGSTFADPRNHASRRGRRYEGAPIQHATTQLEEDRIEVSMGHSVSTFSPTTSSQAIPLSPRQFSPSRTGTFASLSAQRTIIGSEVYGSAAAREPVSTATQGTELFVSLNDNATLLSPSLQSIDKGSFSYHQKQRHLLEAIAELTCSPLGAASPSSGLNKSFVPPSVFPLLAIDKIENPQQKLVAKSIPSMPSSSHSHISSKPSILFHHSTGLAAAVAANGGHQPLLQAARSPQSTRDFYLLPEGLTPAQRFGLMRVNTKKDTFEDIQRGNGFAGKKHERQGRVVNSSRLNAKRPPAQPGRSIGTMDEAFGDTVSSIGDTLRSTYNGGGAAMILGSSASTPYSSPVSPYTNDQQVSHCADSGQMQMSPMSSLMALLDMGVDPARVVAMLEK